MPSLTPSERIGTTVAGRYEIRRLLGEGGFSAVFEAVHSITGREVALKLLHPHLVTTEQITERFLMEARAMARIRHDGIVQVLDAGTDPDGTVYIALELLNGESLETTLLRVQKLTWGEAVRIGVDLLDALAEAHRNKIIHRDIKPGNIFIVRKSDGSSQAKLLDFGIAHVTQRGQKLTQQGMILGTPEYMSPEQSRGIQVGPESDLWSVGIVLFECLVGQTPFASETTTDILIKIATEQPPTVASLEPLVPDAVSRVIDHALAREATKRYRSADEMKKALEAAEAEAQQNKAPSRPPGKPSSKGGARLAPPETLSDFGDDDAPEGIAPRAEIVPGGMRGTPRPKETAAVDKNPLRRPTPAVGSPIGRVSNGGAMRVVEVDARSGLRESGAMRKGAVSPPPPKERPLAPRTEVVRAPAPAPAPPPPSSADLLADTTKLALNVPNNAFDLDLSPAAPPPPAASVTATSPKIAPTTPANDRTVSERGAQDGPKPTPSDPGVPRTSAQRTFQEPPKSKQGSSAARVVGGALVLGVLAAGGWALRPGPTPQTTPGPHPDPSHTTTPGADAQAPATTVPAARLAQAQVFTPGPNVTGADGLTDFARHSAVSGPSGAQRIVVSCLPNTEGGPSVIVHPLVGGGPAGTYHGPVSCAGFDLGVVPDVTDDGTDDIVATQANGAGIVVINSRTLQEWRTIPVPGATGIALGGGFPIRGAEADVVAIVFAEPNGVGQPSEVRAVSLRRRRVLWTVTGTGALGRIGQPVELGLAVGPDATQDGVPDVVMGIGPVGSSAAGADRRRCVQLYSGATGAPVWSEPYCRPVGRSSQSVALGPDVNGDGRADVVVGTDQHDVPAPVVLLSGLNGNPLLTVSPPQSEQGTAFGWPVALSGDLDGDGTPDIAVGTTGRQTLVTLVDARNGEVGGRLTLSGDGAGSLRIFPVEPATASEPWSLLVADPGSGLRLMVRRNDNDPAQ